MPASKRKPYLTHPTNKYSSFIAYEALKSDISQLPSYPQRLERLYHVNDPWGNRSSFYRLQPRQLVTLSRVICLLLDLHHFKSVASLQRTYRKTYQVNIAYSLCLASVALLKKAGYIDNDLRLTALFFTDCRVEMYYVH